MNSILEIGKRALLAQQRGLDITGNNISNVNTPGYTRQEAILSESDPINYPNFSLGTGVFADRIRQYREQYLDKEMRGAISRKAGYETDGNMIQRIQTAINEPSDYGLDTAMDDFFGSVEDLNSKPDDIANRETFLTKANNLAKTFNSVNTNLTDLRQQVYGTLSNDVDQVNRLLGNIAELNQKIAQSKTNQGQVSGTLLDTQGQLLEELSKYGELAINRDSNGAADVTMNGTMVVSLTNPSKISLLQNVNSTTGEITVSFGILDKTGNQVGTYKPQSGELASLANAYNVTLDDKDSSGGFSLRKNLDSLANAFVSKVNSVSQTGYGLDDTGATPPGRNIFTPAASGGTVTAASIAVNPALLNSPRDIPASATVGTPGNSDVFLQVGQLANDKSFVNAQSARAFYASTISKVANMGADAKNNLAISDLTKTQLTTQRESIVGVNLDEEAVNMIKFQRAFEAAARVINTTNDLLGTIVNLGR